MMDLYKKRTAAAQDKLRTERDSDPQSSQASPTDRETPMNK